MRRLLAVIALGLLAAGCTSAQEALEQDDPLEPVNREIFDFNHSLDRRAVIPAATFYKSVAPDEFREHLHYFLTNLHLPDTAANDVLQLHFERSGEAVARFLVNSTLGVAGIFDVASDWGLPYHSEDLGQTLGWYGVPGGPYVVLPLLGPGLPRDLAARFGEHYIDPIWYIHWHTGLGWGYTRQLLSLLDSRSRSIDELRDIERSSIDLYATHRSVYLQSRDAEVHNGEPDVKDLPDF